MPFCQKTNTCLASHLKIPCAGAWPQREVRFSTPGTSRTKIRYAPDLFPRFVCDSPILSFEVKIISFSDSVGCAKNRKKNRFPHQPLAHLIFPCGAVTPRRSHTHNRPRCSSQRTRLRSLDSYIFLARGVLSPIEPKKPKENPSSAERIPLVGADDGDDGDRGAARGVESLGGKNTRRATKR